MATLPRHCYLRLRACSTVSPDPLILAGDVLEGQKLQLTLVTLMLAAGMASGNLGHYSAAALVRANGFWEFLGLPISASLPEDILPALEAIEALPTEINLPAYRAMYVKQPWQVMEWSDRNRQAARAMLQLATGVVEIDDPRRYSADSYLVSGDDMRFAVNLLDAQRQGRKKPFGKNARVPEPGRLRCLDHCEAVLRSLAGSNPGAHFLQVTQVRPI